MLGPIETYREVCRGPAVLDEVWIFVFFALKIPRETRPAGFDLPGRRRALAIGRDSGRVKS